ncbi:MAG: cell division transport system ATP-binding protein [Patescibacteria group bacterium]|jgi:cell division transport system ATP-binding protein|nr:cell division transport system ATP-binding protein [Patescibacteria group bacterium]
MIRFENVTKIYPNAGEASVEDLSFEIKAGEFVSIVGHSGAGKTTIVKLLLGEEKPTKGDIFFDEVGVNKLKPSKLTNLRRRIGTVFQDFRLLPNKTAYENIAFAMESAGKTDEEIESDVPHVLDLVDLGSKAFHFPHQLSGGEKQRLSIARAIINNPEVVVADEPTGNLDPVNTYEVVHILKKINSLGTTVILTTHNKGVVDAIHKRVITLEDGKVVRDDEKGKYII